MSRRKQAKPRHLDADSDQEDTTKSDDARRPPRLRPDTNEYHVCGRCQQEFESLSTFSVHRKNCQHQRIVMNHDVMNHDVMNHDEDGQGEQSVEDRVIHAIDQPRPVMNSLPNPQKNCDSADNEPPLSPQDVDPTTELPQLDERFDEDEGANQDYVHEEEDDVNEEDKYSNLSDTFDENKYSDENQNLHPGEVAMLHSTLYSLQQQQLFQLSLIQQLQAQLVNSSPPGGTASHGPPGGSLYSLQASLLSDLSAATAGLPLLPSLPSSTFPNILPATPVSTPSKMSPSSPPESTVNLTPSTTTQQHLTEKEALVVPTGEMSPTSISPFEYLKRQAESLIVPPSCFGQSLTSIERTTESNSYNRKGVQTTCLDRTQYCSEDPFFKHKCRFCSKIFGSDSALQIHVRSHTGERPYKCNICGNRFSTKGNLKVHFQRHQACYPHIKMNPNPLPEHLDKTSLNPPRYLPIPSTAPSVSNKELPREKPEGVPLPTSLPRMKSPKLEDSSKEAAPPVSHQASESPSYASTTGVSHAVTPLPQTTSSVHTDNTRVTHVITSPISAPIIPSHPFHGMHMNPFWPTSSLLPTSPQTSVLDPVEDMEEFMEVTKSETSKLEQLVRNLETKLTDPNQCAICHRILSCKSALQMHYRIHTGERPFRCKICGRAFTTKGNLKTHMGVHRSKPPLRIMHQCPVCHKQFTNSMVLHQHVRMHTGGHISHHMPAKSLSESINMLRANRERMISGSEKPLPQSFEGSGEAFANQSSPYESSGAESPLPTQVPFKMAPEHLNRNRNHNPQNKSPSLFDWSFNQGRVPERKSQPEDAEREIKEEEESIASQDEEPEDCESRKKGPTEQSAVTTSSEQRYVLNPLPPTYLPSEDHTVPIFSSNFSPSLAALEEKVNSMAAFSKNPQQETLAPKNPKKEMLMRHSVGEERKCMKSAATSEWVFRNGNEPVTEKEREGRTEEHISADNMQNEKRAVTDGSSDEDSETMTSSFKHQSTLEFPGGMYDTKTNTTCDICFKTFACRSALDIHYRSHTKERPFLCTVCDRSFTTRGNMKQHMLTHKIRDLPADFNANGVDESSNLSNASSSVTADSPKLAPVSTHSVIVRPDPPAYVESSSLLKRPSTSEPDSSPAVKQPLMEQPRALAKHQCSVCLKHFSSASALQIHFRTHTGDKPFKCNVCGKAFTTKGNLKVHMGTHMWSNSPSRRGRRMSVENPVKLGMNDPTITKESPAEQLKHAYPSRPPPEMFFPFPPFMGGFMPKLNDFAMMQNLSNGAYPYLPITSTPDMYLNGNYLPLGTTEAMMKMATSSYFPGAAKLPTMNGIAGEKSPMSSSATSPTISESSDKSNANEIASEADHKLNGSSGHAVSTTAWTWKTMCHLCNKVCPSLPALDDHLKSHLPNHSDNKDAHKPLTA